MPEQKERAAPSANRIAALSRTISQVKYIAGYLAVAIGAPVLALAIAVALAEVGK